MYQTPISDDGTLTPDAVLKIVISDCCGESNAGQTGVDPDNLIYLPL